MNYIFKKYFYDFFVNLTEQVERNSLIKVVLHKRLTIQKTISNRLESNVNENISINFFKITTRKIATSSLLN